MSWNRARFERIFGSAGKDVEMTDAPPDDQAGSGATGDSWIIGRALCERSRTTPGPWSLYKLENTALFSIDNWTIGGKWDITNFNIHNSFNVDHLTIKGDWTIDQWLISQGSNLTDIKVQGDVTISLMTISRNGLANQNWDVRGRFRVKKCVVEGSVNMYRVKTRNGFDVDEIVMVDNGHFEVAVQGPYSRPEWRGPKPPIYREIS